MFRCKTLLGAFVLSVVAAASPGPAAADSSCPSGTREHRSRCVLDSDLVLAEPLELPSFATLDCEGHRILPSSAGTGTTPESYVPSVPALAIAITGERRVTVKNCVIGLEDSRFDFGVIAINSKNMDRDAHQIRNNEIHARDSAITLIRVDDARVTDNVITWTNGFGISVRRDSNRNRLGNNVLTNPGLPAAPLRLMPGGPFRTGLDSGISLAAFPLQVLYNLVLAGRLYQFPNSVDGQYLGNRDNIVEGNLFSLPGSSAGRNHAALYVATNELGSRLIGNTVVQAGVGIRLAGLMRSQPVQRAAQCVNSSGQPVDRYCETSADCFIPEIDATPVGTCPTLIEDVFDGRNRDIFVEGNVLVGPFNSTVPIQRAGIAGGAGTVGGILRGNRIEGKGSEAGISLLGNMLETAEVTGNVIHGASFGLLLQAGMATRFGARVFGNDITGSTTRAVGVLGTYAFPTELSWDGAGNYWGHAAPPCFDASDSPSPTLIRDSYPSCAPVASGE
jgi:hypothetical protein